MLSLQSPNLDTPHRYLDVMFRPIENFLRTREVKNFIKIANLRMFSYQIYAVKTCVIVRF